MRRLIAILLTAALALSLAACTGPQVQEMPETGAAGDPTTPAVPDPQDTPDVPKSPGEAIGAPRFTRDELPRFDGSTSTAPLAQAVCAAVLGESREDAADLIHFAKTTNAYMNLIHGDADILIVGESNGEVTEEKERLGFEWEKSPFATDAFVFVVNEDNPVDSITVDEARRIYSGEITNWKELGGEDRRIIPFQRNQGAGSQTLMEKLVMNGTPMMEAPTDWIATTMGELMEAVKGYDNSPGAIGYSVYYYAQEMRAAEGLKLLKLEGVEPDPNTIRSGTYPLVNPKYVVIPANLSDDAPARVIYDWLLSDSGQKLIAAEGYVSILDTAPSERKFLPLVGSRWYSDYRPELVPGNYGALVPYAGRRLVDDWPAGTGCLYGLMTRDGRVVVDPVYSNVEARGNILALQKGTADGPRVAAAARDGGWCADHWYLAASFTHDGVIFFDEDSMTLYDYDANPCGRISIDVLGMTREEFNALVWSAREGGYGGEWIDKYVSLSYDGETDEVILFNRETLERENMPANDWFDIIYRAGQSPGLPENGEYVFDEIRGADAEPLVKTVRYSEPSYRAYFRRDGTSLPELTLTGFNWYEDVRLLDGLIELTALNYATYYDMETMNVVFRAYLGYEGD